MWSSIRGLFWLHLMTFFIKILPSFIQFLCFVVVVISQIDQPLVNDRVDDEPFVNYQERMTRAMKELTKKAHDMVRLICRVTGDHPCQVFDLRTVSYLEH